MGPGRRSIPSPCSRVSFWSELKRRHAIKVGVVYLLVAAAVGGAAEVFLPGLGLPQSALTLVLVLLVLGFPVALVLAWAYDMTPEGVVRTGAEDSVSGTAASVEAAPVAAERPVVAERPLVAEQPAAGEHPAVVQAGERAVGEARPTEAQTPVADIAQTAAPPSDRRSIAVLPLTNLSDDPEDEYFSDGMTDDILTALSFIEDLKVISRTSVMRYKGTTKTIREIAGELGVGTIVEGSVRRAGDRVRIVAQLIDASTDEHLWANTYDRELQDVFAVQSEVAESIAGALESVLSPHGKARLATKPTDNLEAYELVLRGRNEYLQALPENVARGLEFLRQAIELDAQYALAHAHLAMAYFIQPYWSAVAPERISKPAKEAIDRAFELDPNLPEAYAARANWKVYFEWDWKGAEADLARALALNPNLADAYSWRSLFLTLQQRHDEAVQDARHAVALDPLSHFMQDRLGQALLWSDQMEAARRIYESILDEHPSSFQAHYFMGLITRRTDPAASLEHYDRALAELDSSIASASRSMALRRLGRLEEADQNVTRLEARSHTEHVSPYALGIAYLTSGDVDKAFDYFEEGAEIHDVFILFIRMGADVLGIEDHPRYLALRRRIWRDEFGESEE